MFNFRFSSNRKKHQRLLNREMRRINNSVYNDPLWKGRFYMRQVRSEFLRYEDKSGYELFSVIELRDRQTGITKKIGAFVNSLCWGSRLFWEMNNFIVEDCNVWKEKPTYETTIDWRES